MTGAAVLSTSFFPNIYYCNLLQSHNQILIDLGEHFIKQSHRNRTYVLGPNGVQKLIVPLQKWNNHTPVKDVRITYTENWQKQHWKTLESCYRSSPYFEYYEDDFKKLFLSSKFEYLKELNGEILNFILHKLNLSPVISYSDKYISDAEEKLDFRNKIPGFSSGSTTFKPYTQVFGNSGFVNNLSFIDLICNEGPNAIHLL